MEQILFGALLIGAVVLFVTRWLPYEATAAFTIAGLVLTGILTPGEALSGFANSATITIGAMFVLSAGLIRTGALEFLVQIMRRWARGSVRRLLVMLAVSVGLSSAFLNNTPVVVMIVPVALALARQCDTAPSKVLLPVSYFAILGGTCTLIGTSTNLLVDDVYRAGGGAGFRVFEFAPLGLCFFVIGSIYVLLTNRKLLPERSPLTQLLPEDRGATFVTELVVGPEADLVGKPLREVLPPSRSDVRLLEIVRGEHVMFAGNALDESVEPGDSLIVEGAPQGIAQFIESNGVKIASVVEDEKRVEVRSMDLMIVEAVVLPDSPFVGRAVASLGLNRLYGVKIMGIQRHGLQHRYHLRGMRLKGGDVLLLQADRRGLGALRETGAVMVVEGVDRLLVQSAQAPLAIGVLLGVVALAVANLVPLSIAALGGVGVLLATRCLRTREAIAALDAPVLLLIIGTIPLGVGLQKTGLAATLVMQVGEMIGTAGPVVVLSLFYMMASLFSSFLSNNATALLLAPLAVGMAASLGLDAKPFLIAIAFGASASFATPVGYQTNLIVMGPGGYTFGDYLRFGLPLNVLLWIAATFLIPVFYPVG